MGVTKLQSVSVRRRQSRRRGFRAFRLAGFRFPKVPFSLPHLLTNKQLLNPRRSRWPLLLGILFLLIGIPTAFWLNSQTEEVAAWWNPGWMYRQRVDITNGSGSNLTDFQIGFTLDTAALITASKLQNDCDDLRITDHQGTELPYWIEENSPGCNNAATKIWVKLPSIPTSGGSFFLYYGNAQAIKSADQNGNKVFVFFDDFSATSIDASKWTQGTIAATSGTNFSISSGKLIGGNTNRYIQSVNTFTGDYIAETRVYETTAANNGFTSIGFYASSSNTISILNHSGTFYVRNDSAWPSYGSYTKDQWEHDKIKVVGTTATLWKVGESSGSLTGSPTNSGISGEYFRIGPRGDDGAYNQNYSASWDWVYVRKAVTTEPSTSLQSEETTPGPAAYWKLDEGSGSTIKDSVNNNTGTINGAEWKPETECVSGKCLYFDGTTDFVSVANNKTLNPTEQLSVSLWVKNQRATGKHTFLLKKANGVGGYGFYLTTTDTLSFFVYYFSGSPNYQFCEIPAYTLPKDQWTHLTGQFKTNDFLKIFVNGVEKVSCVPSQSTNLGVDTSTLNLGYQGWWGADNAYFKGYLDEIKIFPYARTQEQILQDYNLGSAVAIGQQQQSYMSEGLVGYWKMDEASGTTVADASGNGRTGTLTNAQETGTGEAAGTNTTLVDADNTALSADDDTYNEMILEVTGGVGCGIAIGQKRFISDYTGSTKTLTVSSAFTAETDSCTFLIDHHGTGKFGSGLACSGKSSGANSGDFVSVSLPSMNEVSAFTWYKFHPRGTGSNTIMRMQNDDIGITINPSGPSRFHIDSYATLFSYIDIPNSADGNWHYIGLTYDGTTMTAYFDGQAIGTKTGSYSIAAGTMNIGDRSDGYGEHFNGWIDETRVYNRALKPDEIASLYRFAPGPVGYWKMDDGSGSTATDSSGNGNNAALDGSTYWRDGKFGGSLLNSFSSGSDGVITQTAILNPLAPNLTVEAWFKVNAYNATHWQTIVEGSGSLNAGTGYYLGFPPASSTNLYWRVGNGTVFDADINYANHGIQVGDWVHVAGTLGPTTAKMYVNGKLVKTDPHTIFNIGYGVYPITIGSLSYATGAHTLDGLIDEVRIYNYERTAQQIVEDMNAGHPAGGSPVGSQLSYWPFDEQNGTVAHDRTQTQNLTVTSASWKSQSDCKVNGCLDFDNGVAGSTAYFDDTTASIYDLTNDFTFGAWVYRTGTPESQARIISKGDRYLLYTTNTNIVQCHMQGLTPTALSATSALPLNSWTHVLCTYKDNVRKLYIDGVLNAQDAPTGTMTPDDLDLVIGNFSTPGDSYRFRGKIDEVKLYSSALTAEQVKLEVNQGSSVAYGGTTSEASDLSDGAGNPPVLEWKFDDKTGTSVTDTSGNGNNGSIVSTPSWKSSSSCNEGSCLEFTSNSQYVTAADPGTSVLDITGPVTLEAWVWWDQFKDYGVVANKGSGGTAATFNYGIWSYSTSINCFIGNGTATNSLGYNAALVSTNAWHHLVCVADGTNLSMYIDGKRVTQVGQTVTPAANNAAFIVGENGRSVDGKIDTVKVYNYARTPAQIAYDYNRGTPIAHWKLDECQGTTLNDSSGNNYSGTWSGSGGTQTSAGTCTTASTAWGNGESGKFNGSLNFDGTDDRISIPGATNITVGNDITVSAWVKTTAYSQEPFVSNRSGAGGRMYFGLGLGKAFLYYSGASPAGVNGTARIDDNVWHHVVYVRSGTTTTLYVDGKQDATATQTGVGAYADTMYVAHDVANNEYYPGQIDDIQIFNYALSADQIAKLYNGSSAVRFDD